MSIARIIIYISAFIWLLPPIRQYKRMYFLYFLILGLSDPINILLVTQFSIPTNYVHSISSFCIILTVITFPDKLKYILIIITSFVYVLCLVYIENLLYLMLILHFSILIIFIKRTLIPVFQKNLLSIFNLALLFYELSIVVNFAMVLGGGSIQYLIYYVSLFFQLSMAIFFTIFTEKSPLLLIYVRSAP